ncbi:MAG: DUF418 domain-containing protein [Phycisphaerales bacterium]
MDHDHPRTPVSIPDQPAPTKLRYSSIDTLRGFALLGILVPNIWFFAWPMVAGTKPDAIMSASSANHLAHDITSTLFLGKFMFLFALLFGSGVIMYARKFDQKTRSVCADCGYDLADLPKDVNCPECNSSSRATAFAKRTLANGASLWYIRCAVLLFFGLIHAYVFWYGDILTFYAIAGLTLLWWVRRLNPKLQLWGGLGLYFFGASFMIGFSFLGLWALNNGHITTEELTGNAAAEIKGYTGSFLDAFLVRFPTTLSFQLMFGVFFIPALWGIMTAGMGLTRLWFLSGERPTRFYAILALVLLPVGLITSYLAYTGTHSIYEENAGFVWQSLAQPVGVPLAFGYASLIIALSKIRAAKLITVPLAAVGRMALSNYFAHTLLCTTFFYGYGLGYFAQIEYPQLWLVVLSVWAFNIVFSLLWLRAFRMGPFEWVWRCLTYRQLVPIR